VQDGKVASRGLTSRLGHVVQLSDGEDPSTQFVLVQLAGQKHTLRLGKERVELEVPGGTPLTIKAGNTSMSFSDDGSISIQGTNITIKAQQNLSLEGLQGSIKANGRLNVQANAEATFKGTVVQVEGSGVVGVKGGIVQIN
jgi:uncharacterized protein (DUF2345 family)